MNPNNPFVAGLDSIHALRSFTATYKRGFDSSSITTYKGSTKYEVDDGSGLKILTRIADFIVPTNQLVLATLPIKPKRGDRIERLLNGKTYVYEIIELGSDPPSRPVDDENKYTRIHTQLIETI